MINANNIAKIASMFFIIALSRFFMPFKVSALLGHQIALFSLFSGVLPMISAFVGLPVVIAFMIARMAVRSFVSPVASFKLLAFYVPGMVASATWIERFKSMRFFVPLVCMALFVLHPVGGIAWLYSLYWLIPIVLYVLKYEHIFAHSLSATLVAHAVGSTIWLYADPMTPAVWLGLIPVVAIERLFFACGMTIMQTIMVACLKQFSAVVYRYQKCAPTLVSKIMQI